MTGMTADNEPNFILYLSGAEKFNCHLKCSNILKNERTQNADDDKIFIMKDDEFGTLLQFISENQIAHLGSLLSVSTTEITTFFTEISQYYGLEDIRKFSTLGRQKPKFALIVNVLEAKQLEAKDSNGFSDPYCILGIIPNCCLSQGYSSSNVINSNHGDTHRPSLDMNDQFRLVKIPISNSKSNPIVPSTNNAPCGTTRIPSLRFKTAYYSDGVISGINHTKVISRTLDPCWNEKFQLKLENISRDSFLLEIWDHDEETTLLEAMKNINEVRGAKQLGRYFKEVQQSARSVTDKDSDDFLGSVLIELSEIPYYGLDQWFKLGGRSAKSKVRGEIHLRLEFTARTGEDHTINVSKLEQHIRLTYKLLRYELKRLKKPCTYWSGELCAPAQYLLDQHALLLGLDQVHVAMCHWMCISKIYRTKPIDCLLLQTSLENLLRVWTDKSLTKDCLEQLNFSFKLFTDHALQLITQSHILFPQEIPNRLEQFEHLLRCLRKLHDSRLYQFCCPFGNSLQWDMLAAFKKSATNTYAGMKNADVQHDELADKKCAQLIGLLVGLKLHLQRQKDIYSPRINEYLGFPVVDVICKTYLQLVKKDLYDSNFLVDLVREKCLIEQHTGVDGTARQVDEGIFQIVVLYHKIKQLIETAELCEIDWEDGQLNPDDWLLWFRPCLELWIDRCQTYIWNIIRRELRADQLHSVVSANVDPVMVTGTHTGTQQSRSADILIRLFNAIVKTWVQLEWYKHANCDRYVESLSQLIGQVSVFYVRELNEKLRLQGYCDQQGQFDIADQLCIALNNMEAIFDFLKTLPDLLHLQPDGELSVPSTCFRNGDRMRYWEAHLSIVATYEHIMNRIFLRITAKMRPEIRKNMFHLCWSGENTPIEKALNDLEVYLCYNFKKLKTLVSDKLLKQCFLLIWDECLEQFVEQINRETRPSGITTGQESKVQSNAQSLFSRYAPAISFGENSIEEIQTEEQEEREERTRKILLKLMAASDLLKTRFHHSSDGLLQEDELNQEKFRNVQYLIKLHLSTTTELIELYFIEKLNAQANCTQTNNGVLYINLRYQESELTIEVVRASGLLPLDSNGLSDPFVLIDLVPRHIFSETALQARTKIVKSCLDPVFNETFHFTVSREQLKHPAACVAFVVMDHDILLSDDLEGVAFAGLAMLANEANELSAPGFISANLELSVLRETTTVFSAIRVIQERREPYAQEFYKKWSALESNQTS